jgi:hypothetical protein
VLGEYQERQAAIAAAAVALIAGLAILPCSGVVPQVAPGRAGAVTCRWHWSADTAVVYGAIISLDPRYSAPHTGT